MIPRCFHLGTTTFLGLLASAMVAALVWAQLTVSPPPVIAATARNGTAKTHVHRYLVGMTVGASAGDCQQIVSAIPVPGDWPEQEVSIVDEDFSHHIQSVQYGKDNNGIDVIQVSVPYLAQGESAKVLVTYEVTRRLPVPPHDTTSLHKPTKVPRMVRSYLGHSPLIEVRNGKIRRLSKAIAWSDDEAWQGVQSIYDTVRDKVTFQNGPLRGAARALQKGTGNHEDITSLFIALCRIKGVPARTVWVPDQCYAEFYLEDSDGHGQWFVCQLTGNADFGTTNHTGPVLQKGDNFKVRNRRKPVRFVPETLSGAGQGQPNVNFIRQLQRGHAVQ